MNQLKKVASVGKLLTNLATRKPVVLNLNLNVTNFCNQACPFCNADMMGKTNPQAMSFENFKKYYNSLKPYGIPSITISGGEPTLGKDLPQILEFCAGKFPMGVTVNTNLYAPWRILQERLEPAMRHHFRIGVSFDGFGHLVDELRGAKDVADRVSENIKNLTQFKKEKGSKSILNLHTVVNDRNIDQIKNILKVSEAHGWTHTLAPVNEFFYLDQEVKKPIISRGEELKDVVEYFKTTKPKTFQKDRYLNGIPYYAKHQSPKICPFLTETFKVAKIFVEPTGELTLCDRGSGIGNLNENTLEEMLESQAYLNARKDFEKCGGCWLTCFVNIELAMPKPLLNRIIKKQNPGKSIKNFDWMVA